MAQYPKLTALDRLVGLINPRAGLARYFDRLRLQRAYEAASPRDPWRPRRGSASANADHYADAALMRAKARALVQNVPYMRAGLDALVSNTIGTGITTYGTGPQAKRLDELWAQWVSVCDADGRLDWYGLQAAAYRAMEQDGEVLLRLRPRLASDGLPVPLQLQLLEVDWLDATRTSAASAGGALTGNQVINGVEYDALGRAVAYWLWDRHPGDVGLARAARAQSKRVAAENIVHLFNPERPGQGRGITRLSSVITRVRDLQLLEDAELARKNLEARLGVLVSGDPAAMRNPADDGSDGAAAAAAGDLGQLPSGGITALPAGVNVTTVVPQAAPGHVENVKHHLHVIAVGMGVTYEMLTGEMKDVNFSSARVRLIDFRRQVESMQWLTIIPRLVGPVRRAFVDAATLARLVPGRDYACDHSTPKWDYVNPADDAESELKLISGGLLTWSESLRRRGYKPETVFAEYAADVERLRGAGLLDVLLNLQGRKQREAPPVDPAAQAAGRAAEETIARVRETVAALAEAQRRQPQADIAQLLSGAVRDTGDVLKAAQVPVLEALVAMAQRADQPTHVTVNTPPVEVHNDVHVPAQPAPEVRTEVHVPAQPAPTVIVQPAAAEVRVSNTVTVEPAEVKVLALPRRTTVTDIQRDSEGELAKVTQTEFDDPQA